MSVSSLQSSTGGLVGNNSTTTGYVVPFAFQLPSDLVVVRRDSSGNVYSLLFGTDYTVSQNPDLSGGTVYTTTPWDSTNTLGISRIVPLTQLLNLIPGAKEPAAAITQAFDKLTYIAQQLSRNSAPDTITASGVGPYVLGLTTPGSAPYWVPQSTSAIGIGSILYTKLSGSIPPSKLSLGAPTWDTSGNFFASTSVNAYPSKANSFGVLTSFATNAANAAVGYLQMYSSASAAVLNQVYNLPMVFLTNNTSRLSIAASGNVEIFNNLEVDGSTTVTGEITGNLTGNVTGNVTGTATGAAASSTLSKTTAKAWVNFNGSTAAIRSSYNVSSITKNDTGDYTINFSTALTDANYSITATSGNGDGSDLATNPASTFRLKSITSTTARIVLATGGGTVKYDSALSCVSIFGN